MLVKGSQKCIFLRKSSADTNKIIAWYIVQVVSSAEVIIILVSVNHAKLGR